jgi:hypothetical protein
MCEELLEYSLPRRTYFGARFLVHIVGFALGGLVLAKLVK